MRLKSQFVVLFICSLSFVMPAYALCSVDADADAGASDTHVQETSDVASDATATDVDVSEMTESDVSTGAPAVDKGPSSFSSALKKVKKAVSAFKNGAWLVFVLAVIQIIMFIVKRLRPTKWIVKKHGTAVILSLSLIAGVLTLVMEGNSWVQATIIFLTSSGSKYAHDLLHIFGLMRHREDKQEDDTHDDAE